MCLAIFKPANSDPIPQNHITNAYGNNPEGFGVCYAQNGKLVVKKGMFDLKKIHSVLKEVPQECPALIHFRYATHKSLNTPNCHPFLLGENKDVAMIHNGRIPKFGDEYRSDTRQYAEDFLSGLFDSWKFDKNGWDSGPFRYILFNTSGGAKMAFLNKNGEYLLTSKHEWTKIKGSWYSNEHSLLPKSRFLGVGQQYPVFTEEDAALAVRYGLL